MSITSSFYSGLSGLDTHATAMQVIGDNISNVQTAGFKGSSVQFADVLGQSLSGVEGGNRTGAGVKVSSVDNSFVQGSLQTTDATTDVAINGKGFFIVQDPSSAEDYYTRSGHFSIDNEGFYVNNLGYRIQGYLYDDSGENLIENLTDIQISQNNMASPKVTGEAGMVLNLDASAEVRTWDIGNPSGTSNFSTALSIYDSLGQSHQLQIYFTKTAPQTWDWHALVDGSDVQGGVAGVPQEYGTGTMGFDDNGKLTTAMPANFQTGAITFSNGLAAAATTVDFTGSTQFGSPSAVLNINQDGYAAGTISGVAIDENGNIVGNYTNGVVRKLARLAVADFRSIGGLERKGATLYQSTTKSGAPVFNKPGVGGMGTISSSMLEESNVDLAAEFIRMIIVQRGYQANSKVISTTDSMLAQLMNMNIG